MGLGGRCGYNAGVVKLAGKHAVVPGSTKGRELR